VAIAELYQRALVGLPGLTLPATQENAAPVWHLFVIRHPRRDALQQKLTESGVGTLIHYPVPPHRSKAYADLQPRDGKDWSLPIAEALSASVLSLPMGPHLQLDQARLVADVVARSVEELN
jgi:dTDP-4-amino-4,6-dideoxygalactose transaminase